MRLNGSEKLPSWVSLLSNSIQVDAWVTKMPMQIEAAVFVSFKDYPMIREPFPFNITIIDLRWSCVHSEPTTYKLGNPALTIPPEFQLPVTYGSTYINLLTPVVEPIIRDHDGKDATPSVISFMSGEQAFKV